MREIVSKRQIKVTYKRRFKVCVQNPLRIHLFFLHILQMADEMGISVIWIPLKFCVMFQN